VRLLAGRRRAPPARRRRAVSTGMSLFLIAAGAILLLAVPAGSSFGINLHVVGIIVILTSVLGLLLPPETGISGAHDRLRRWVNPSGTDAPDLHDVQSAAAEDVKDSRR
jgi:hypothetical protein